MVYLKFTDISHQFPTRTTKTIEIHSLSGTLLGGIQWFAPWRRYCYYTESDNLILDKKCMFEIVNKIEDLMRDRK